MRINFGPNFSRDIRLLETDSTTNIFRPAFDIVSERLVSSVDGVLTYDFGVAGDDVVTRIRVVVDVQEDVSEYGDGSISFNSVRYFDAGSNIVARIEDPDLLYLIFPDYDPYELVPGFTNSFASRPVSGNSEDDTVLGGSGNDRAYLGGGDDKGNGRGGNDRLFGQDGDDTLIGGGGRDRLNGGAGDDTLTGGGGRDRIDGGAGSDLIDGGKGRDTLTGGEGRDGFEFRRGSGVDIITDFETGVDTLLLNENLWGGGLTRAEVVEQFASYQSGSVVFGFGANEIVIDGFFNPASLVDDILFV